MKNNLAQSLKDFKNQYPFVNSVDLQTFILGYSACLDDNQSEDYQESERPYIDDSNEQELEKQRFLAMSYEYYPISLIP